MKTKRNVNYIEIQPLVLEKLTQIDMELDEAKGEMEKENLRKEYDDWMELATLSFSVYENDGKYGVKLSDGRIAEPAVYDEVRIGDPEVVVLAHKGDEWIVLYEYLHRTDAHIHCEDLKPTEWAGVYMAQVAGLWGLYDTNKNDWMLPPDYNEIISNGWNTVLRKGDKYGFFGYEFYVPAVYDGLRFCRDWGYVGFYKGGVLGYIDKDGRWTDDISKACVWAASAENRIWPKKTWTVNVVVELDFESVGEIELEVPMTDKQMDAIEQLENEYEEGIIEELDQDVFAERLPEIYTYIEDYVNKQMPNEIDLQEGESIDDYSWRISFSY